MKKDLKYKPVVIKYSSLSEKISKYKIYINILTSFTNINLSVKTGIEENSYV